MPSVYLISIYSLFDLANIQKGHVSDLCLHLYTVSVSYQPAACFDPFCLGRCWDRFHSIMPIRGGRGGDLLLHIISSLLTDGLRLLQPLAQTKNESF